MKMSKLLTLAAASAALAALAAPAIVHADEINPMDCSVSVVYSLNNVERLRYERAFIVGLDSPYSEDFSTATRLRFFDAFLTDNDGVPQVTITFDADVSVFNAVDFTANLNVKDQSKGETSTGVNRFFSSVAGAAGNHTTAYTLTCSRAR